MPRQSRPSPPAGKKKPGWKPRLIVTEAVIADPAPSIPGARPNSKAADLLALLRRQSGASLVELMSASSWQSHSVRAWLSGVRRRYPGQLQRDARENGATSYRLV